MNLTGKLLIAMPGLGGAPFERSVVFLCAHSAKGAVGLIVNKPAPDLSFDDLLEQLGIDRTRRTRDIKVHYGGPVEHGRGFVLHSGDYHGPGGTLRVDEHFAMTATLDILEDIAKGRGPDASMLALGYAGWGPGQLESEIRRNGWLTCDATSELVFGAGDDGKWTGALASLGVDPRILSTAAGRA